MATNNLLGLVQGSVQGPGLVQRLRVNDHEIRTCTLEVVRELRIKEIVLASPWPDLYGKDRRGAEARDWFHENLVLFKECGVTVYPRLFYTPPALCTKRAALLNMPPDVNLPPDRLEDFADFCGEMVGQYGHLTGDYWHLWTEPNNDDYWSERADKYGAYFRDMVLPAIELLHDAGKKVVIGGIIPPYLPWLSNACMWGILEAADAIGVHAPFGTRNKTIWYNWTREIEVVRKFRMVKEVHITEGGFSTANFNHPEGSRSRAEFESDQLSAFDKLCSAPAEKKFWYSTVNQPPDYVDNDALIRNKPFNPDIHHFGKAVCSGTHKPLFDHWKALADAEASARKEKELGSIPFRAAAAAAAM